MQNITLTALADLPKYHFYRNNLQVKQQLGRYV